MRYHAAVVACDDHAAAACGLLVVHKVLDAQARGIARGAEGVGCRVGADTADEEDAGRGQDVLVDGLE